MKKVLRIVGIVAAVLVLVVAGVVAYYYLRYPAVEKPPQLSVKPTAERVARGRYLVNHVTICLDCHSTRNYDIFAGPIVKGTEGKGGERFGPEEGLPGLLYASNITPAGPVGKMTDGDLFRTITSGVRPDNSVLFPMMPYTHFNQMADEDLYAIIAYLRTLKPIANEVRRSSINFPVSMFIRAVPAPHAVVPEPARTNRIEYGKYLVNAAVCSGCHTQAEKGAPKKGMDFAGGNVFKTRVGTIRTANITPDEETGIGYWSEDFFVDRFKYYASDSAKTLDPKKVGYYTVMPWMLYAGMNEEDLRAIYAYLRTLPPVKNAVVKFEPLKTE